MLRSMFSAISGLRAHQTKLDVTGNNIANVNTVGYKSSQTVFEDTLSQVIRNGSAPTAETGGTNPAQVGLGVKVAGITTNFGQGSTQNTGRATDFMISGDGFFVTKAGNENLYTRAGSFDYDGAGNLVTPDGAQLQGWTADANGEVNSNGPIGPLRIPFGQVMAPTATTEGALVGNLSTGTAVNDVVQTQVTAYDSVGTAHEISLTFTKGAANTWTVAAQEGTTPLGSQALTFDPATGRPSGGTTFAFTVAGQSVGIDLTGMTEFGGKTALTPTGVDGNAMGTLQSISLSNDGTIMGVYSNSLREPIGKLAMATFANPGGLSKAGNTSYRVGDNSGQAVVGEAGTGGRGSLTAGALEMSNVDLAEEFTGLIVAQRGFQANSRVITSSDEILQDLVNLKR
ncbi:flagellar hook protein FlgE [Geodermatophilus aquaeductus]|uniref:Flagellar hook protein FlgE n=1 Tax=Geodermatophilus aquaeductus TaxID=1564161 RepID=A0A521CJL0_9ACTN|nr:flagellar hook protein FlgE [Geodermatophilus aquaeductus]SMO59604.1 flagellar hook protein FlgE [Geodermatophilus aquaeductus]